MAWFQPSEDCEENCCPVPPCEDDNGPTLTCRRYEEGYGPGGFEYTVDDADIAWITESCGSVITIHMVELTDRAASGVFPVQANCTYCIRARNFCGETFCCDNCDQPACTLSATLNEDGSVTFSWTYATGIFGDPITVATLNGVDILDGAFVDSGTMTIAKADLPDVVTMFVANDCGKSSTCTFNVPCCWNKEQLRISFDSVSDISRSCSQTYAPAGTGNSLVAYDAQIEWTGLTALAGSYLFDVSGSNCSPDAYEYYIGDVNARWYWQESVRGFQFGTGITTETSSYELVITGIKLFLRNDGIWLQLPATGNAAQTGRELAGGSLVDPSYANVVTLRTTPFRWVGISGSCPQKYDIAYFQVWGTPSRAGTFGGWITGTSGPGPFFTNPQVGIVQASAPAGWCPGIMDNHPISYEAEYLS